MLKKQQIGVLIIIVGLVLLLNALDLLNFSKIISTFWPLILVYLGLTEIINQKKITTGPLILFILGVFFQVGRLNFLPNLKTFFWPIVLIVLGVWLLIFKSKKKTPKIEKNSIDQYCIFGGLESKVITESFEGGFASVAFGGMEIDLSECCLKNDTELELTVLFGGIELTVPENWEVKEMGTPIFGGFENSTSITTDENRHVLLIKYFVMFGGIEIKN